jgi:hypothetical protein
MLRQQPNAAEFLFTHVPVTVMDDAVKRTVSACLRCCVIWDYHPQ